MTYHPFLSLVPIAVLLVVYTMLVATLLARLLSRTRRSEPTSQPKLKTVLSGDLSHCWPCKTKFGFSLSSKAAE
ncbi:MAG: hypothetical protein ACE5JX_22200 [Acidobacteriota bacterium]